MEYNGQYLTYNEYVEMGGTLAEMPFNQLELQARSNINDYTHNRLANLVTQNIQVKQCEYDLIQLLNSYKAYNNQSKSISSENTDGYSISYSQASENVSKSKVSDIKSIITEYLDNQKLSDGTPYLYMG